MRLKRFEKSEISLYSDAQRFKQCIKMALLEDFKAG